MTQILALIDRDVFAHFTKREIKEASVQLGAGIWQMFTKKQVEAVRLQISDLDPAQFNDEKDFVQTARDLRLLLRFWTDLANFVQDCSLKDAALTFKE